MLINQKILITGVTGDVVFPIARALAEQNQVWGLARFKQSGELESVQAAGITPVAVDLTECDLSGLPDDFSYLLHFAWMRAGLEELEQAFRVNVEAAGLLLQHCRRAKAALVVSSQGVYSPNDDPHRPYRETDPVGRGATAYAATSPATKLGLEAVARFCARAFDLPITIARLNTVLGHSNCYHANHVRAILRGDSITVPGEPNLHSPIHTDDMIWQVEPLLQAATVPALITNWCGDEIIATRDACAIACEVTGMPAKLVVNEVPGIPKGNPNDVTRRRSITGPCRVGFEDAYRKLCAQIVAEYEASAPGAKKK